MKIKRFGTKGIVSFCVCLLICIALSNDLSAQHLKINYSNAPLKTVLKTVTEQSGYSFVYSDAVKSAVEQKVTCSIKKNAANGKTFSQNEIKSILSQLLAGTKLSYSLEGTQVVLYPKANEQSQNRGGSKTLNGVITDENGEPLPGVTIHNRTNGKLSASNADGHYTIEAEAGDNLLFTFMGMEGYTMTAGKNAIANIVMKPDAIALENVIITGYQTISKERSAASYSVIKGDNVKSSAMSRGSILESLEGAAAGFTVNTSNNSKNKYLVRGITSINSNQEPLFVLDGVAVSTDDVEKLLSANDIASITVLKDATAVSIWGSRAANGVIVLTSKEGSNTNGRINVSYDGNFTYKGKPSLKYYNLMDSKTFIKNALEVFENPDYQNTYTWDVITNTTKGLMIKGYDAPAVLPHEQILYDWQRGLISQDERDRQLNVLANQDGYSQYKNLMMTNMWNTSHNVSVSGGTERFKIFGSLGYDGTQGNMHNTDNTYKANVKQEYTVAKWLNWDLTLNVSHSEKKEHTDFLNLTNWSNPYTGMLPYAFLKNSDGSWTDYNIYDIYSGVREKIEKDLGISTVFNPVTDFFSNFRKTKDTRFRANTGLQADIWKGIAYEVRFQYLRGVSDSEYYIPGDTWHVRHNRIKGSTSGLVQLLPKMGGDFEVTDLFTTDWTIRNQISYNRSFKGNDHQITALLGTEYRENKTNSNSSFKRGYDYQTMSSTGYDMTAAKSFFMNYFGQFGSLTADYSGQSENVLRYVSYYGNLAYTFKSRYSINGSARIDQSNLFGTDVNSQYKPIGSIGVSWRMKEEKFLKNVDWLNSLTTRLSWGHSGNSPLPTMGGPYDIIGVYVGDYTFNNLNGYVIDSPSNKKIGWETTRTWNFGVDFSFLNYRIDGSLDLYHKKTSDLLSNKTLNVLTGYESIYANVGSLENKGFELSLNTINIQTKEFTWTSNLVMSYNKNKVLEYYQVPTTSFWSKMYYGTYSEGYPAGAIWRAKWGGLRHEDGVPQVYDKDGNLQYNYNSLTADDAYCMGTTIPKWSGSFTNTFSYKDFDLTAQFIFNLGHKMGVYGNQVSHGRLNFNRYKDFDKRWRQPGDEEHTIIPSAYEDIYNTGRGLWASDNILSCSDVVYQSASYAKLRELTLSYSLPETLCTKLKIKNAKLRLTGHDILKIVANDRGIDPEIGFNSSYGSYYSVGLSINF